MWWFLALACVGGSVDTLPVCAPEAPVPTPAVAAPGDSVLLATEPLTEVFDTVVTVGAARAEVLAVDRSSCGDCDTCRAEALCSDCGACESCDTACDTCAPTVEIVVPSLPDGSYPVTVVNTHGTSAVGTLTIASGTDSGA
jgi:hypothetical protein